MSHHQGSTLARLASHWSREDAVGRKLAHQGAPDREGGSDALVELAAETRDALATVQPCDLEQVAGIAETLLARAREPETRELARRVLFRLLDTVRRRSFTDALRPELLAGWTRLLVPVIDRADYTLGEVLRSREETDARAIAMRVLGAEGGELTVADVARRTRSIARGLFALMRDAPDGKVAILSENSLEAALCDLACLTNGILDFPLPANATAEQVAYMLRHSGARVLVASDEEQVSKVLPALSSLPELRDVVVVSRTTAERHGLLSLEQMVGQGGGAFDDVIRVTRSTEVRSRDLATVMYTSGTTGHPKGITVSHLNIVSKRLCRGFALRHVGEGDIFLCYLPLYHTFGRWLEMTGCLWWGATYVFARSTSHTSLLEDFMSVRPTVFISVPKKWIELHESALQEADAGDPREASAHLEALTGGRLRYGLSAAGHLDPAVFKSFHQAGIELCSGYGMTEATGGITMTPPGEYLEHSIGRPLPGIECLRADDGELLVRGPYVSQGYYDPGRPGHIESAVDAEGWFGTGDLVSVGSEEPEGHFRIVGRKKEIYKNRAGQTIAPQRVENLFRDFDAVAQAFLVGDHHEYNTLLIWPNREGQPSLRKLSPPELYQLLSSLVTSANRFLAPFERVVTFQVLPRALDEVHGELTHKGTFRREVVEENWAELIGRMYAQKHVALMADGMYLRIPNWVLREIGVLQQEVSLRDGALLAGSRSMMVGADPSAPGSLRLGDLAYAVEGSVLDFGALLARPALWLGNGGLVAFLGEETFHSLVSRRRGSSSELRVDPRVWLAPTPSRVASLLRSLESEEVTFQTLQAAGELLRAERPEARQAVSHLRRGLASGRGEHAGLCRALLRRAADSPDEDIRRCAFRALLPDEEVAETIATLRLFLDRLGAMALRDEDLVVLGDRCLSDAQVEVLLASLSADEALEGARSPRRTPRRTPSDRRLLIGTMRLLTAHAIAHPRWYARVRVPLARLSLHDDEELAARAGEELDRLRRGFSNWIGPNLRLAVDPESGSEYGWRDVVAFEHGVSERARELLLRAVTETTLVRGSVFLFGRGALVSLADIPPGGATVSKLGTGHGKSVYRLSIHTRARESFDIAVNLVSAMHPAELSEEISWLLAAGAPPPLVEAFGGYYAEYGIFTEEYIPGDHVARQVERLDQRGELKRLRSLWPFLAWSALSAHIAFWDRTGRRLALRVPSPETFVVPSHDYHAGTRIVTISDRSACASFDELLDRFQTSFLDRVEASWPELRGEVTRATLFSAVVEALGLNRARNLLEQAARERRGPAIAAFLEDMRDHGYTPLRVYFAARRYGRWLEVNPTATMEAKGKMLGELWGTYRLAGVEHSWPDTRIRFFRQTVFAAARPELGAALDRLMSRVRAVPAGALDLEEQVAANLAAFRPTVDEDYFLARMTYRYLAPGDDARLISLPSGDKQIAEVVMGLRDEHGRRFLVRGPASPREVARLLQLFQDANLAVTFTAEHEFLLALDAQETVLGGVFYRWSSPDRVHMEKVVVARKHRGLGVADGLMWELFRRLRAHGAIGVETGYYQPEYLSRYGFRTDPTSGGLMADLAETEVGTRPCGPRP
jgi:long-subunit acyl-CoA synthetase (AMP-forming)/predicted GNAT superfamily acetyltransferase